MNGHTSQPQQRKSTVSPVATAISLDNISSHTPPPHTNNNNKQPYVVFAPEKSPIFMTSRHRALHCEMDDPSQRLPYVWGRSLTRKTPMEWVKAKFTACFNHQYFDDDAEYIVPLQHSTGGTLIRAVESTVVDRHAVHNVTTTVAAASGRNDVSVVSEEGEAVSIDGTCVVDFEAASVHVQEQQEYREPTPLPKLTIHMSPLRTSVAQLPLDEQTISMLRMSLLLGGGGNLGTTNDDDNGEGVISGDDGDDNDKETSFPRFADLLGMGDKGGVRPPSFAFQPAPQQHHAAMSTASSPQKIAAATAKPSSSTATSSGGGGTMKPLKQTTVSLSQLLAVASGDAARRTPTIGHLHRHPDNKAMATSKVNITERLSEMKGFTSAPNSPIRMRKQKNTTTGMVAGGGAIAIAPPPPPQAQVQARVPVVPASAPATPLEKLLKPTVMPRMNKASQARATAVRERLERMACRKNGNINTKKKSTLGGDKTTTKIAATTAPQMNYSQILDRQNNNNNNLSHQQQQEIALRLSSTTLAMSKLSEQALVAAAAKAAGVDIVTYQKSRQQYIQMLSRLAIGLAVDPVLLKQSKLPSPPTSSIMSVSESGSSSRTGRGGTYQAQKAAVPTIKHLPAINTMHGTTNIQPHLSPNHAYGLKHDYGEGGETTRGKVHQRLVSMTDVAAASKKGRNVDMNVDVDVYDRGDMIKAKRGEMEGNNNKMMKTEVSLADLLEKSLREGGSGNGNGGLKVTDSLTFAELEARGITLKDLLRVRVAVP